MSLEEESFEFDEFVLDARERTLRRAGEQIALTPKAFLLLKTLIENHGRLVTKSDLMQKVWPDSFVEESNLSVTINTIRNALGDQRGRPRYIETIPKSGYRFIAEVRERRSRNGSETQADGAASGAEHRSRAMFYVAAVSLLIASILATAAWFTKDRILGKTEAPILSTPFRSVKFSTSGTVTKAAISPDGKYAAFADTSGGSQSLWLRQIDSGENIQIVPPSSDHYFGLAFANGGNSIYFVRKATTGHGLAAIYRVATFGGVPAKIIDGAQSWISLSPDDKQISFVRCNYASDDYCSLFVADVDGTNERKLFSKPAPTTVENNQFSPDGRWIAVSFGELVTGSPSCRIALIDIATGAETEIGSTKFFDIKSLQWLPAGDALLFTVRDYDDGRISIWKTPVAGGEPEILSKDASTYRTVSLDKKGERMIATQEENDFQIYVAADGGPKPITSARDLSVGPDGKIVYSSFDGDIWTINRDGGERRQLTTGPGGDLFPQFSHDGQHIFFKSNRSVDAHVWRMNSDGSGPQRITQKHGGTPCGTSSDGTWLFYVIGRTLHKIPIAGGSDETRVSATRMLRQACSPDGSLVAYYFLENGFKIAIMNTSNGQIEKVINYGDSKVLPRPIAWSPDSRTLNFVINSDGKNTLWRQSLTEPAPLPIADLGGDEIRDLAIMPDGKTFVFIRGKWIYDAVIITGLK